MHFGIDAKRPEKGSSKTDMNADQTSMLAFLKASARACQENKPCHLCWEVLSYQDSLPLHDYFSLMDDHFGLRKHLYVRSLWQLLKYQTTQLHGHQVTGISPHFENFCTVLRWICENSQILTDRGSGVDKWFQESSDFYGLWGTRSRIAVPGGIR